MEAISLPPKRGIAACKEGGCVGKGYRGRGQEGRLI